MKDIELGDSVDVALNHYIRRLFMILSLVLGGLSLIACPFLIVVAENTAGGLLSLIFVVPCAASFLAAFKKAINVAFLSFSVGILVLGAFMLLVDPENDATLVASVLLLIIVIAAFCATRRTVLVIAGSGALFFVILGVYRAVEHEQSGAWTELFSVVAMIVLFTSASLILSSMSSFFKDALKKKLGKMDEFVSQLETSGGRMATAATEIYDMANQQRLGAFRQSSAVKQTREALHSTLNASREIANSARAVYDNADRTSKNSEEAAARVAALAEQAHRIAQILDTIRGIANKSELLALNAALESTKAGEAGRGFSFVAGQMQQLAERVMGSVKDIKGLTADIREATHGVQLSMEETIKLARATTEAGREISLVTQQQQTSTEQVTNAMDDIAEIISQAAAGSEQTLNSTKELRDVAGELPSLLIKINTV